MNQLGRNCIVVVFIDLLFLLSPKICSADLDEGLVAFYTFDGDAKDHSSFGNHGRAFGARLTKDRLGNPNGAYLFDGLDDYIQISDSNSLDIGFSDYSIVAWIKLNGIGLNGRIFSKGSFFCTTGYMMRTSAGHRTSFFENSSGDDCRVQLPGRRLINDGKYHLVVGVMDRDVGAKLYLDGTLDSQASVDTSQFNLSNKNDLRIGMDDLLFREPFNGIIDEVRIYNRVLSPREIKQLFDESAIEIEFSDISLSSGIANQAVRTSAAQWIDYNGDKRMDIYLVGSNGNVLFKNIGSGKFIDVTSQLKIGNNGKDARGASWADINNDGKQDVFVANATGPPTLLLNKNSVFQDISNSLTGIFSGGTTSGGIWIDINNDNLLDLFVFKNSGANQLFKQTGPLKFTDVSQESGVSFAGSSRSAVSADFNGDGFVDIYLANFNQPNRLYMNNGNETFTEVGKSAGVAFKGGSVQVSLTDFNGDQNVDLFVVNNNGASLLYRNNGGLKFSKLAIPSISKLRNGIAAAFADFDLDGNDDLVLAQSIKGNFLFKNDGTGNFKQVNGIDLNNADNPTGVALGDLDNNGKVDIFIADGDDSRERGDSLYKNESGGGRNFRIVTSQRKTSNRSGIGAKVFVQTSDLVQVKVLFAGDGTCQDSLPLGFGIGKSVVVDSVPILWLGGVSQLFQSIWINQNLRITEPR